MHLAEQLDNTLRSLPQFLSARERAGRVWVADGAIECPRPLAKVASALCGNLEEMGFELQVVANEPSAYGTAPCILIRGVDGLPAGSDFQQVVIVPQTILSRLRELQRQVQALNRKDASYDNVKAFTELISQGLFLSRRSVKNNQRAIEQRKRRFKPV
jgi:hypothetical protein